MVWHCCGPKMSLPHTDGRRPLPHAGHRRRQRSCSCGSPHLTEQDRAAAALLRVLGGALIPPAFTSWGEIYACGAGRPETHACAAKAFSSEATNCGLSHIGKWLPRGTFTWCTLGFSALHRRWNRSGSLN